MLHLALAASTGTRTSKLVRLRRSHATTTVLSHGVATEMSYVESVVRQFSLGALPTSLVIRGQVVVGIRRLFSSFYLFINLCNFLSVV